MKKLLMALMVVAMLAVPAHAEMDRRTVLAATTLTKSESDQSVTIYTGDMDKLAIFIDYTPTATVAENIAVTMDVSYDGTNWVDANFYDYTGGLSLQTSETLSADGWYYMAWNPYVAAPYVRVAVVGDTAWTADSEATITIYTAKNK